MSDCSSIEKVDIKDVVDASSTESNASIVERDDSNNQYGASSYPADSSADTSRQSDATVPLLDSEALLPTDSGAEIDALAVDTPAFDANPDQVVGDEAADETEDPDCWPQERNAEPFVVMASADSNGTMQMRSPMHFLVHGSYLYFIEEVANCWYGCQIDKSFFRVESCGGQAEELSLPYSDQDPIVNLSLQYKLVSGGDFVFYLADRLYRLNVHDRFVEAFPIDTMCIWDVAANDEAVFLFDTCMKQIVALAHGDDAFVGAADIVAARGVVAVNSNALYYSQATEVWRKPLNSASAEAVQIYAAQTDVVSLAADDQVLVVVAGDAETSIAPITRISADGSEVTELGLTTPTSASLLNRWNTPVDNGDVYAFEDIDDTVVEIRRYRINESNAEPVLRSADIDLKSLTVNRERMYWAEKETILTALARGSNATGPIDTTAP